MAAPAPPPSAAARETASTPRPSASTPSPRSRPRPRSAPRTRICSLAAATAATSWTGTTTAAAAFHAAEAARNAPKSAAIRTVYQLVSLLGELNDGDHYEVLELLRSEIAASDQHGVDLVRAGWRLAGCAHPISCASVDVCASSPF